MKNFNLLRGGDLAFRFTVKNTQDVSQGCKCVITLLVFIVIFIKIGF